MTTRTDVIVQARTWLGTPYVHQGRLKDVGVDCVGLPICVCRELKLVAPEFDINGYTRDPDGRLLSLARQYMTEIPLEDMLPGHVIVLSMPIDPRHFGILGDYRHGGLSIIHAYGEKVIETRLMMTTALKFVAAFKLPGVED